MSSVAEFELLVRKHWTTCLPAKVADLKARGEYEQAVQGTAKLAQDQVDFLVQKRHYQEHEAKEVALAQFVYLTPELGADQPEWEREELAELEREYQRNPPVVLDDDESFDVVIPVSKASPRREVLSEIRSQLLALSVHARDGTALIGLGEAVNGLDLLLEGGRARINVEVSIGYRFGGEGMYACIEVDERGVRLSTMSSGAETINYGLDWWDFSRWRDTLNEIINLGGRLTVSKTEL